MQKVAWSPSTTLRAMRGEDIPGLLERFSDQRNVQRRTGHVVPFIVIQEAGLGAFWIHRALITEGIESHVVDPASIAVPRRHRRAKTDQIDGEALVRTLMAFLVGTGMGMINPASRNAGFQPAPRKSWTLAALRILSFLIGSIPTISMITAILTGSTDIPANFQAWVSIVTALLLVAALPVISRAPEYHGS